MELVAKLSNIPFTALSIVAEHLRKHGAAVVFDYDPRSGSVEHPLGKFKFAHNSDQTLSLFVPVDLGAIPRRLLSSGIRRIIEQSMQGASK